MKKKYIKPMFVIESFQLDATIAASCSSQGYLTINYSEKGCGFGDGVDNMYIFFNFDNCDLDLTGSGGDGNDTTCYHGPLLAGSTFINS